MPLTPRSHEDRPQPESPHQNSAALADSLRLLEAAGTTPTMIHRRIPLSASARLRLAATLAAEEGRT
jgi:hypothetical protein